MEVACLNRGDTNTGTGMTRGHHDEKRPKRKKNRAAGPAFASADRGKNQEGRSQGKETSGIRKEYHRHCRSQTEYHRSFREEE